MRFSNQYQLSFNRSFGNDLFDWQSRNYSATNDALPFVNIKEDMIILSWSLQLPVSKKLII
jgi:hypothetical protein